MHQSTQALLSRLCATVLAGVLTAAPALAAAEDDESRAWAGLRAEHFGDEPIAVNDDQDVVSLDVPFRAQDPALTPMTINDRTGPDRRITELWLVIDENPLPVAAHFRFGPMAADATLSSRIRINAYSHVRAIARTDDGALHMAREHVRASGGCAAPISRDGSDPNMGEMRFRTAATDREDGAYEGHLRIRHPMVTGLQMNQVTRLYPSADYLETLEIDYGGERVLDADLTFTFSENPSFRFHFLPQEGEAEMAFRLDDTEAREFQSAFAIEPAENEIEEIAGR